MKNESLKHEIDVLIAALGDDISAAKPAAEKAVLAKIRLFLDSNRDERTGSSREIWEYYLPYAAKRCLQLTRVEEGWEEDLDYFVSEDSQFWLDNAGSLLEKGEISGVKIALEKLLEATRIMKRDRIAQVDILLQALDIAVEITDKKHAVLLYEDAEKVYRKHLLAGAEYTGSGWVGKIKKMGQRLAHYRDRLQRYFAYAETVTVSIEADMEGDLERVIDYLQQSLIGKIKVTRRVKETDGQAIPGAGRFRARLKITLG